MIRVLLALLLLGAAFLPVADAGDCHHVAQQAYTWQWFSAGWYPASSGYAAGWYKAGWYKVYHAQKQVQAHHATYSVSYNPDLDKLLKIVERQGLTIDKLIDGQQQTAPERLQQKAALDGPAIMKLRCASCHAPTVAEEKGESIAMFDDAGEPLGMSASEAQRAERYVKSTDAAKRCPKKAPLPAGELKTLVEWLKVKQKPPTKE